LWIVPATVAVSVFAFGRLGLGLTYLVAASAAGLSYEWVHFLVHSDYRPVTRAYRAVWNNHRLHHYKNEHYWFTVTSSGTADGPTAAKVTTEEHRCDDLHLLVVGSHGSVRRDGAVGTVSGHGVDAAWELQFDAAAPELRHLPYEWMYRSPVPRTKSTSPYPS